MKIREDINKKGGIKIEKEIMMKLKRELKSYRKNMSVSEMKKQMRIIIKNWSESEIGEHIP